MSEAFVCDVIRTPFGRFGGSLSTVRTDDLAAIPIKALIERSPSVDWAAVDDVIYGCANQSGEDNRNVARMALLLAGLPQTVAGSTVNRLCGSSLDAVAIAARAIKTGEASLVIAGGVESMSRAPFVMGKAEAAFSLDRVEEIIPAMPHIYMPMEFKKRLSFSISLMPSSKGINLRFNNFSILSLSG